MRTASIAERRGERLFAALCGFTRPVCMRWDVLSVELCVMTALVSVEDVSLEPPRGIVILGRKYHDTLE